MPALLPELIPDSAKVCRTGALPASRAASLYGVTIVLQAPASTTVQPDPIVILCDCDQGFSA